VDTLPHLDPIDAYDRIATAFPRLSEERRAYLDAVDRLIVAAIPTGSRSLLDVGAGDGVRALRVAREAGLTDVTLLEPSAGMRASIPASPHVWAMRAEDLVREEGCFDAITCLWNVLGHIFPAAARGGVLRECARLVAPDGAIYLDLNHRYNARHYGPLATARRFLYDHLRPNVGNGDVTVRWAVEGGCATAGHVFTGREVRALCESAGLRIEKRLAVDYATGRLCRWTWQGNLLFVLRRARA
jgi:2-polyprenyl-3-methyl-5-hydroxy-6-metoxy-1,4-benzoquinol methylase